MLLNEFCRLFHDWVFSAGTGQVFNPSLRDYILILHLFLVVAQSWPHLVYTHRIIARLGLLRILIQTEIRWSLIRLLGVRLAHGSDLWFAAHLSAGSRDLFLTLLLRSLGLLLPWRQLLAVGQSLLCGSWLLLRKWRLLWCWNQIIHDLNINYMALEWRNLYEREYLRCQTVLG